MDAPVADEDTGTQAATVAFLASPEAHGGRTPEHVETHLSHVFLAGGRALKLKKARRWSMVDYSTAERREHFCRRELAVNAAWAPELYRAVRPVTRAGRTVALDGPGAVIDWVVEMRRFPADAQLDRMADAGTLDGRTVDAVADMIAATHRSAAVVRGLPISVRTRNLVQQLERDVLDRLGETTDRSEVALWAHVAFEETLRRTAQLDRRARHGFVRRCHGDLHLSNICLWQGEPVPFDAVEFSDDLATIDVVYDLAFVLVDLEHRGQGELSLRLLSRYLEGTRDYAGLSLLPLFKSQRAMVRALVAAMKGREARPHVLQARALVGRPAAPRLIAVGGLSGTGKSSLARALAPRAGAVVIRADGVRKRLFGLAPEERLPTSAYCAWVDGRVYRRMLVDARRALAAGASVILDATFAERDRRRRARMLAESLAVPFQGLWLEAPLETVLVRLAGREGDASDADADVARAQFRRAAGAPDWAAIDAGRDRDAVLASALRVSGLPAG